MKQMIMKSGIPNSNGRVYSGDCLKKAEAAINSGKIFVTLDSPEYPINLSHWAAISQDAEIDGNTLLAGYKILDTPSGKILADLLKGGCNAYMAISGLGTLDKDKTVRDFELTSLFITSEPNAWSET